MTDSIQRDPRGPDWPLGFIGVAVAGTPVGIMSLVDASSVNSPNTLVPPTSGATPALTLGFSPSCHQIMFQALKPGVGNIGTRLNTGLVYVVRVGKTPGTGNREDMGSIVKTLTPGETWVLSSNPANGDTFSPYRYRIDGDNVGDGAFVTLLI